MKHSTFLSTTALVAALFAADNMVSAEETIAVAPPVTMSEDGSFSIDEDQAPNFMDKFTMALENSATLGIMPPKF